MKIQFRKAKLSVSNRKRLDVINSIIQEYQADGYVLTLRQLYYQLVSRDVIPNQQKEYAKLSTLLKEGRMSGIVDWDAIEDRLRQPSSPASFESPLEILKAATKQFALPRMEGQETYIEVWVEKDALSGVLGRVTRPYHIPIMVNRGYSSASAMYDAFNRFKEAHMSDQSIRILYLGDYDPSGIDMIRDIECRISEFFIGYYGEDDVLADPELKEKDSPYWSIYLNRMNIDFKIIPVALTREQIDQYQPPENPAKRSDPRAAKFIAARGSSSWEVDALRPEVLNQILTDAIEQNIDRDTYLDVMSKENAGKEQLKGLEKYLSNGVD